MPTSRHEFGPPSFYLHCGRPPGASLESASAAVHFVRSDNTALGDGNSWPTAYKYLQTAIAAAQAGDEIWVKTGTHLPDVGTGQTNDDRDSTFTLKNGVAIYGGFDGSSTSFNDRDPAANVTILSGDLANTPAGNADNSYHVVTGTGTDATAILDGFTITGGYADTVGSYNDQGSGLICSSNGAPTLKMCHFTGNMSSTATNGGGGAVYINGAPGDASPSFTDCTFSNNVGRIGGAVFNQAENVTFTRCAFSGNSSDSDGGAVISQSNVSSFIDCTFTNNQSGRQGGAVTSTNATTDFTRCDFTSNTSVNSGGALFNSLTAITLTDCNFNQNSGEKGGAISNFGSSPSLDGCTFTGNSAMIGGAMNSSRNSTTPGTTSNPNINDCTFTDNSAGSGGALHNLSIAAAQASSIITDSTFTGNSATSEGGAVSHSFCTSQVSGTTFEMNTADGQAGAFSSVNSGTSSMSGCTFTQNSSVTTGGAFVHQTGTVSIHDCVFTGNSSGAGGAARFFDSVLSLFNCSFTSNSASAGAGGAIGLLGDGTDTPSFTSCSFIGNEATSNGGACNLTNTSPTLSGCLFSGNLAAQRGAAAYISGNAPQIRNCSASGNRSEQGGTFLISGTTASIQNTVIHNNEGEAYDNPDKTASISFQSGGAATYSHCLLANFTKAELDVASSNTTNFEPDDPMFVTAVNPATAPTTSGNLQLRTGSPAIDVGDNNTSHPALDVAGNPRIFNSTIDLGAYENQGPDPFTDDDDGDGVDNGVEIAIGTNPSAPDLNDPKMLRSIPGAPGQLSFGYDDQTASSILLELRRSTDLLHFNVVVATSDLGFPTPGPGGIITITDPSPPGDKAFYRLQAVEK